MMGAAKQILLAAPEGLPRRSLADQLAGQGFDVRQAGSETDMAAYFETGSADAVLLDAGLPGTGASSICRRLRQDHPRLPIILLGGEDEDEPSPAGPDGVERVKKPFRLALLVKKLSALRSERTSGGTARLGGFVFDAAARTLTDGCDRRVPLTEKEAAILAYLLRAEGRIVSREELLAEVWGYADGASTHTVETHIYRLRRKLGEEFASCLTTESGGYRLEGTDSASAATSTITGT